MRKLLLAATLLLTVLSSATAASAESESCSVEDRYPGGAVFSLQGTPHLWIFDAGNLRWAGDTRALAAATVRWDRQCTIDATLLQSVDIGEPLLSLGLVKIGEPIYLAKWETSEPTPRLLHVQSLADVAVFGINADNYGRFVLDRGSWEQRFGFSTDALPRDSLAAAIPRDAQIATAAQSGWATVTSVPDSFAVGVANARGQQFGVWHVGVLGPTSRQADWQAYGIEQHRGLLPPGTRVWLEKPSGVSDPGPDRLLRHISLGPGQRPLAERLLRGGAVWLFPHGMHPWAVDYAEAQAAAARDATGVWAGMSLFRPQGASRGGYPVDPAVEPVLAALDQHRVGSVVLQAVNGFPVSIRIAQQGAGILASFRPRSYSIELSPQIMAAEPSAVAGVLIHELTHAQNLIERQVDGAVIGCYEDEHEAFEAVARYWGDVHPNGKRPSHWLDVRLNENLAQYRNGTIADRVRQDYGHQCEGR